MIKISNEANVILRLLEDFEPVKEDIYRTIWAEHVAEDIKEHYLESDIEISDSNAEYLAELYVNGEYDCNLSYWENIENLYRNFL